MENRSPIYNLTYGETYKYRVFAFNDVGDTNDVNAGPYLSVFCASAPTVGPTVELGIFEPIATAINITWPLLNQATEDPNAGPITGYLLYGNTGINDVLTVVHNGTAKPHKRWFVHESLIPGRSYRYQVSLLTDAGESPRSDVVDFQAVGIPTAPTVEPYPRGVLIAPSEDLAGSPFVEYEMDVDGQTRSLEAEARTVVLPSNGSEIRLRTRTLVAVSDVTALRVLTDDVGGDQGASQLRRAQISAHITTAVVRPDCEYGTWSRCAVANDATELAVHLSWRQNHTHTFVVEKDSRSGPWRATGVFAPIARMAQTFFVDTAVRRGDVFRYRLAVIVGGKRFVGPCATVRVATAPSAPLAPTRWDRWNATSIRVGIARTFMDFGGGPLSYTLEVRDDDAEWRFLAHGREASLELNPRLQYYFRARAHNAVGSSPWSPVALLSARSISDAPAAPLLVWSFFDIPGWEPRCPELTDDANAIACIKISFQSALLEDDGCGAQSYVVYRDGEVISNTTVVSGAERTYTDWLTDEDDIAPYVMSTINGSSVVKKFQYQVQMLSCLGVSDTSEPLVVPLAPTPKPVCGRWDKACSTCTVYHCVEPGLSAFAMTTTTLYFEWIGYANTPSPIFSAQFFREIPFQDQLVGSSDKNTLLGYKLYLDDGLRGPFAEAYDGTQKRLVHWATVENLLPGRTYRAFVTGVSWVGEGESSAVLEFPMALPPEPPSNVTVVYADTKAVTFRWKHSVSMLPVRYYRIERAEAPVYQWQPWFHYVDVDGGVETFALTNLLKDTWYEFRVRALSDAGAGLPSPLIPHLVGDKPVGSPTNIIRASNTETSLTLSWKNADVGDLGIPFLSDQPRYWGYRVYLYRREYEAGTRVCDTYGFGLRKSSCVIPNLVCGRDYKFTVSIVTIVGEGAESAPLEVTLSTAPSHPRDLTAQLTVDSITLRWTEPHYSGCTPIYQYRILRDPSNRNAPGSGMLMVGYTTTSNSTHSAETVYVDRGDCFPRSTQCVCPPHCLLPGQLYQYRIQARGAFRSDFDEYGPPISMDVVFALPPASIYASPQWLRSSWGEFELVWPAAENYHAPILDYQLEVSVDGTYQLVSGGLTLQRRVSAAKGGALHRFRIIALSSSGVSDPSPEACLLAASAPQAPRLPVITSTFVANQFSPPPRLVGSADTQGLTLEFGVHSPGSVSITIHEPGDPTKLVGGSACRRVLNVLPNELYQVVLGGVYDETGCSMEPGLGFEARLVLLGVGATTAVDVAVPFMNPRGVTNVFTSGIVPSTPLTLDRVSISFTPFQRGIAWGMVRRDDIESVKLGMNEIKAFVGGEGHLGGCRIAWRAVQAEVTAWNFYDCGLVRWAHYRVFVYLAGITGDGGGVFDSVRMQALPSTNLFASQPWIVIGPTGDGLTVEFVPQKTGMAWIVVSLPDTVSPSTIKTYPSAMCTANVAVSVARQRIALSGCFLTSGPKYIITMYLDVSDNSDKQGSVNRPYALYVPLSNSFIEYFQFIPHPWDPVPLLHGMGFTFRFVPKGVGFYWALLVDPARRSEVTVTAVKAMGSIAVGEVTCHVARAPLDGSLVVQTISACYLTAGKTYDFYIYLEGAFDVNDGLLTPYRAFTVPWSNSFIAYPLVSSFSVDSVSVGFTPRLSGRAWAMVTSSSTVTVQDMIDATGALGASACVVDGVPVTGATTLSLSQCALSYRTTYHVHVYIDDGNRHQDGTLAAGVPFKVKPSNEVTSHSMTLIPAIKGANVTFATTDDGVFWLSVVRSDDLALVTPDTIKSGTYNWGSANCTVAGQALGPTFATSVAVALTSCRFISGDTYFMVIYVELATSPWNDGELFVVSDELYVPPSNTFLYVPRVMKTADTNDIMVHYEVRNGGRIWIFIVLATDAAGVTYFNAKSLPYFVGRNSCVRSGSDVNSGSAEVRELLQCELSSGVLYNLFLYVEDFNRVDDGYLTPAMDIVVPFPRSAAEQILFYRSPYQLAT